MKPLQMNYRQLVKQREDRHAIHYRRLEQKSFSARRRQVPQFPVRMNDRPLIRRDGVSSMLKRRANVVDGRLAVVHVERSRFEKNISPGSRKPLTDVVVWGGRPRPPKAGSRIRIQGQNCSGRQSGRIRNPPQPPRSHSRDAPGNSVTLA